MRIFKNKLFHRWAEKINLNNDLLKEAALETVSGYYEAKLGGCLYKKRIALDGKGKRSSTRTIIAFKKGDDTFFVYGFAKNAKVNINIKEKQALKELAEVYFSYNKKQLERAIEIKEIIEVL